MAGGGLLQLVAYGAQDLHLTGEPKVTFFQAVYKRHTSFTMEATKHDSQFSFSNGLVSSIKIDRRGDLLGDIWLELPSQNQTILTSPQQLCWVAENALKKVELVIGGQVIDTHYKVWWRLWSECFLNYTKKINWGKMTSYPGNKSADYGFVYLPLLFFFCRNEGLFLPLIALQNHEIYINFHVADNYSTYFTGPPNIWINYVFLDTHERALFGSNSHEYLIEQVQYAGSYSMTSKSETKIPLAFNHPVKELIWCYTDPANSTLWDFSTDGYSSIATLTLKNVIEPTLPHFCGSPLVTDKIPTEEAKGPLLTAKILFNNQDRFQYQTGKYFNQYQPFKYHSGTPYAGIYTYSFALDPEAHQPSGTCNFSRIVDQTLVVQLKSTMYLPTNQQLFAVNYNVLRIKSGMAGLAFAN